MQLLVSVRHAIETYSKTRILTGAATKNSCVRVYVRVCPPGPGLPGFPIRRGPMVEKAVQTLHVEQSRQRGSAQEQDPRWVRRRLQGSRGDALQTRPGNGAASKEIVLKLLFLQSAENS